MNSEPKLDKPGIAHIFDHLIQEELRIMGAYNLVMARLHRSPSTFCIETIQKHHEHVVSVLCETVRGYGALPSRLPAPNTRKQKHLRLVAQVDAHYLPELIWLETELLREYEQARQLILSQYERQQILDPTIEAMRSHLAMLRRERNLNPQHP